jgi:hypothetical protein
MRAERLKPLIIRSARHVYLTGIDDAAGAAQFSAFSKVGVCLRTRATQLRKLTVELSAAVEKCGGSRWHGVNPGLFSGSE